MLMFQKRNAFLLFSIFLLAFSIGSNRVLADCVETIYNSTLPALTTGASNNLPIGYVMKMNASIDTYLVNVTIASGCTATYVTLWNGSQITNYTPMANVSVSGGIAVFNYILLKSGGQYIIMAGNGVGGSYTEKYANTGYPDTYTGFSTNATGMKYFDGASFIDGDMSNSYNIQTVITSNGTCGGGGGGSTYINNLWLNGTLNSNKTYSFGQVTNGTATSNDTATYVYRNETSVGNHTTLLGSGLYVYKVNSTNNATGITYYANVTPAPVTIYLAINGTQANASYTYPSVSNATSWTNVTGINASLLRNGSSVGTQEIASLDASLFNYTATMTNSNYSTSSVTRWLNISKRPIALYLAFNGTQNNTTIAFPSGVNVTVWNNISASGQRLLQNGSNTSYPLIFQPSVSVYNYSTTLQDTQNNSFSNVSYLLTVTPGNSGLSMSASPGWSIMENSMVTITCTGYPGVILYRDGITVSNPYSAVMPFGTYQLVCNITDQTNYTPATTTNTLNVQSGGFGCTDTTTFAFRKTLSVLGTGVNINFSSLVTNGFVKSDLSDVYLNTSNASITGKNGTSAVINIQNVTSIQLLFGNYLMNYSYSNVGPSANTTNLSTYEEINDYYVVNLVNEITGVSLLPPNATNVLTLFCSGGTSSFGINETKMTVATFEQVSEIKTTVTYSSTEIYYRTLLVNYPIEYKNMYLVDANNFQMVQFIIRLQDNTGSCTDPIFRMKKYLEGTLQTMTELYFDAENKAVVFLINGDRYQVFVDCGTEERNIGYFLVDPTDLEKTIVLGSSNVTNFTSGNVSTYLNLVGGVITFRWRDQGGNTQGVEFWVYNYTNSSQLLYYTNSTNYSYVEFNYNVPDPNASYIAKYLIHSTIFGLNTTGAQMILTGAYLYPSVFPLLYLLTSFIGTGNGAIAIFVMAFILPIAMLFTEKHRGLAGFSIVAVVSLLDYWHVIVLPVIFGVKYAIIGLALFMCLLIELKSRRTVYYQ